MEHVNLSEVERTWIVEMKRKMASLEQEYREGVRSILASRGLDVNTIKEVVVNEEQSRIEFSVDGEET